MNKPILYLDMDGVVVDFPETIEEIDQSIREKCREWCVKNSKHHSDFEGLFATLKPMDGAIEAIEALRVASGKLAGPPKFRKSCAHQQSVGIRQM